VRTSTAGRRLTSTPSVTLISSMIITARLTRHGSSRSMMAWSATVSTQRCAPRYAGVAMQDCPPLLPTSHTAKASATCMCCTQTVRMRCPRTTTRSVGRGVCAATVADGRRLLCSTRERTARRRDAAAMRSDGEYDYVASMCWQGHAEGDAVNGIGAGSVLSEICRRM
jgi:hypothetical protein